MNKLKQVWNARIGNGSLEHNIDEGPTVGHIVIAVGVFLAFAVVVAAGVPAMVIAAGGFVAFCVLISHIDPETVSGASAAAAIVVVFYTIATLVR